MINNKYPMLQCHIISEIFEVDIHLLTSIITIRLLVYKRSFDDKFFRIRTDTNLFYNTDIVPIVGASDNLNDLIEQALKDILPILELMDSSSISYEPNEEYFY